MLSKSILSSEISERDRCITKEANGRQAHKEFTANPVTYQSELFINNCWEKLLDEKQGWGTTRVQEKEPCISTEWLNPLHEVAILEQQSLSCVVQMLQYRVLKGSTLFVILCIPQVLTQKSQMRYSDILLLPFYQNKCSYLAEGTSIKPG